MGLHDVAPAFTNPPAFNDLEEVTKYLKEVVGKVAIALNEIDFMVNGNINFQNVKAKSITADRMNVDQLSAISANLGHITAGLVEAINIFGSYIATSRSYPLCEMSNTRNLFGAYYDANNKIEIEANYGGSPALNFLTSLGLQGRINTLSGFEILNTSSVNKMVINGGVKGTVMTSDVTFDNFGKVISLSEGTLENALDRKANTGVSTGASGSHNHGIPDGTVLRTADGGTVTFFAAPAHTHAQL